MVMTAHVLFPALDEEVPATMSRVILDGWLRQRLGFRGVICSDDMEMKAVRGRYALEHQLDLASRATVDLFIVSEQLSLCWESWETLVRLQEQDSAHDRLAIDSMARVHQMRERFLLEPPQVPGLEIVGSMAHKQLAARIAERNLICFWVGSHDQSHRLDFEFSEVQSPCSNGVRTWAASHIGLQCDDI